MELVAISGGERKKATGIIHHYTLSIHTGTGFVKDIFLQWSKLANNFKNNAFKRNQPGDQRLSRDEEPLLQFTVHLLLSSDDPFL